MDGDFGGERSARVIGSHAKLESSNLRQYDRIAAIRRVHAILGRLVLAY